MFSPFNLRLTTLPAIFLFMFFSFGMSATSMEDDSPAAPFRHPVPTLSKSEIKEINKLTGYDFQNKDLLQTAFVHSSLSGMDATFERLESIGDGLIQGIVTASLKLDEFPSESAIHDFVKSKTENSYFAARYEVLGLSRFLRANPAALLTPTVTGKPYKKAYADGLEALIGAIKVDWEAKYPHLRDTGRVFTVLTPVVRKIVLSAEAAPSPKPIAALKPTKAPVTAAVSKPKASVRVVKAKASPVPTSSVAAAKPKKPRALVTVSGADGGVIITKQAKGKTQAEAQNNVIKLSEVWEKLGLPACKAKKRKWENFVFECQKKGYTVMAEAS